MLKEKKPWVNCNSRCYMQNILVFRSFVQNGCSVNIEVEIKELILEWLNDATTAIMDLK